MTDLLSIKVPSIESIETMEKEDLIESFLILLDHFYRAIEEIKTLRAHLREAQVTKLFCYSCKYLFINNVQFSSRTQMINLSWKS